MPPPDSLHQPPGPNTPPSVVPRFPRGFSREAEALSGIQLWMEAF
jgi:hypothetical protein